jgi:hypothetical protein
VKSRKCLVGRAMAVTDDVAALFFRAVDRDRHRTLAVRRTFVALVENGRSSLWRLLIPAPPRLSGANSRQHVADALLNNGVGEVVEVRRFGIDDDNAGASRFRSRDCGCHRIDLQRAAHSQ